MAHFKKECFGTKLIIETGRGSIDEETAHTLHTNINRFESDYSRFIDGNLLDTLNREKSMIVPKELISMVQIAQQVSMLSEGYFDISVITKLEDIGYGKKKVFGEESTGYKNIQIHGDRIQLNNNIRIELGGVGKGYMVDIIHSILDKKYEQFIINFGGDIRIKGSQKLFLEDPLNESKSIGEIELSHLALAGSNPRKRMTKKGHHLINPFPERPIDQKLTVFTSHKLACFADAFATALYVAPLEKSIKILEKVEGLEGMIIAENGEIYKSQAFDVELYI